MSVPELSHIKNSSASIMDKLKTLGNDNTSPKESTQNIPFLKFFVVAIAMGISVGIARKLMKNIKK